MSTTNRMNSKTFSVPAGAAGAVVVGNGCEGMLNGGDRVGMTFDVSAHGGVQFTVAHAVRKTAGGAWTAEGSDAVAGGSIAPVDLVDVVGVEYRATLTHDQAGPLSVPVELTIQRSAS